MFRSEHDILRILTEVEFMYLEMEDQWIHCASQLKWKVNLWGETNKILVIFATKEE